MAEGRAVTPVRHAALCTCAPSRMIGGAFCPHPAWKPRAFEGIKSERGEVTFGIYRCTRCGVEVRAIPEEP